MEKTACCYLNGWYSVFFNEFWQSSKKYNICFYPHCYFRNSVSEACFSVPFIPIPWFQVSFSRYRTQSKASVSLCCFTISSKVALYHCLLTRPWQPLFSTNRALINLLSPSPTCQSMWHDWLHGILKWCSVSTKDILGFPFFTYLASKNMANFTNIGAAFTLLILAIIFF